LGKDQKYAKHYGTKEEAKTREPAFPALVFRDSLTCRYYKSEAMANFLKLTLSEGLYTGGAAVYSGGSCAGT
jgi:hypothetical protein